MKKIITLSSLLLCSTVFAPGNSQQFKSIEDSAHDVIQEQRCMKGYVAFCCLFCAYCCAPRSDNATILPEKKINRQGPNHMKMD